MPGPHAGDARDSLMVEMVIQSNLDVARAAEDAILREVDEHGYPPEVRFAIQLALEEAFTNAIQHGNGNDVSKHVRIRYGVNDEKVEVWVADEGPGFDPGSVPDPTSPDRLSSPRGRGLLLMRSYMDEVTFSPTGNEIRLIKRNT